MQVNLRSRRDRSGPASVHFSVTFSYLECDKRYLCCIFLKGRKKGPLKPFGLLSSYEFFLTFGFSSFFGLMISAFGLRPYKGRNGEPSLASCSFWDIISAYLSITCTILYLLFGFLLNYAILTI